MGGVGIILSIEKGAVGKTVSPLSDYEVTAGLQARRLLLFISLNNQADNFNDQNADLNQIRICNHCQPPFREIRGQEAPLTEQGTNRLPFIDSAMVKIP